MGRLINRRISVQQIIPPTDFLTSTDGNNTAIDTRGWNEAILVISKGIVDDVTLNFDIQQSDEAAANFATVPAPVVTDINPRLLTFVNADDNTSSFAYFDLTALKRYFKPIDNLNANSALYGATLIMFGPEDSSDASTAEVDAT